MTDFQPPNPQIVIPLGALAAIFLANDSSYNGFVVWMPLIGVGYLAVRLYLELDKIVDSLTVSRFISALGYGFWISLAASVLLLWNNSRDD